MNAGFALHALGIGTLICTLCAAGAAHSAKPPGKPGKPGSNDDGNSCSYPAFADSPKDKLRGAEADFDFHYGDVVTTIKNDAASSNFLVDGSMTLGNWVLDGVEGTWLVEDMEDVQHRVGNQGITADGAVCSACTPVGKRWSAWYDGLSETGVGSLVSAETVDGNPNSALALGGRVIGENVPEINDPTRVGTDWYSSRPYTTWLSTFQRELGIFGSAKQGSLSFGPGTYIETKVSFEQMQTPGFRLSMWLMPVEVSGDEGAVPSIAYDSDYKNGYEIDMFEHEPT